VTGDPIWTGGLVPGTGESNRIPPGSGNVTGERAQAVGVRGVTAEREQIGGKGSSIRAKCLEIRDKLKQ
jgi:hypothetical protein